jgi:hypothetical protein
LEYTIGGVARASGRFFQRAPHGFGRNCVDHLEFDEFVGQELHGPAPTAIGSVGARQGDEEGFLFAIELAGHGCPRQIGQAAVQAAGGEARTDALDGANATVQGRSDLCIGLAIGRGQEHMGAVQATSGRFSALDQGFQGHAFVSVQINEIFFVAHGWLLSQDSSQPTLESTTRQ